MKASVIAEEIQEIIAVIRKDGGDIAVSRLQELHKKLLDKTFVIHWRDGSKNEVVGPSIEAAFTAAGYGAGAVGAIDYYEEKKEDEDGA